MKPVPDVRVAPYRWICQIFVTFPRRVQMPVEGRIDGPTIAGTGLLVSPRYVLTCGHILRGRIGGEIIMPTRIMVIPARRPGASVTNRSPFGEWEALPANSWVHPNLFDASSGMAASFDFGLLRLESKNGGYPGDIRLSDNQLLGWWGAAPSERARMFANTSDHGLAQRKVNVAGYPRQGEEPDRMRSGFASVVRTFPRDAGSGRIVPLVTHRAATTSGVSGGPIWTFDENPPRRWLVALHTGTFENAPSGLLIRPPLIGFMQDHGLSPTRLRVT